MAVDKIGNNMKIENVRTGADLRKAAQEIVNREFASLGANVPGDAQRKLADILIKNLILKDK